MASVWLLRGVCIAVVLLSLLAAIAVGPAAAFHFTLPSYDEQCFIFEAGSDLSTVTATYRLTPKSGSGSHAAPTVEAVVYDPQRTIVMKPPVSFNTVAHFSFQTASIGRYDVCFKRVTEPAVEMEIDIDAALDEPHP